MRQGRKAAGGAGRSPDCLGRLHGPGFRPKGLALTQRGPQAPTTNKKVSRRLALLLRARDRHPKGEDAPPSASTEGRLREAARPGGRVEPGLAKPDTPKWQYMCYKQGMIEGKPRAPNGDRRVIRGEEAREFIEQQLAAHEGGLADVLAPYEARAAVRTWHLTIRAVEEFINLPLFGDTDVDLDRWLIGIPLQSILDDPAGTFTVVRDALAPHYDIRVVQRYLGTLLLTAALAGALRGIGIDIPTVGAAAGYYQSRRRHMVSLLYTMPRACRGRDKLDARDALNILMPHIELSCIAITNQHANLSLLETFADFTLTLGSMGALASHGFDTLETGFLEPERASIMAMHEHRPEQYVPPQFEATDPRNIFSAAELRNNTRMIAASYAAYVRSLQSPTDCLLCTSPRERA